MIVENNYEHCGTKWTVEHCESFHNDECPECSSEITPVSSTEFTAGGEEIFHDHTKAVESETKIFEVSLSGHDAETEETDNLVLWIEAVSAEDVEKLLSPVKALLCDDVGITGLEAGKYSYEDGVDLKVSEATSESVLRCIFGKYAFINGIDLSDYDLTTEEAAAEISRQAGIFVSNAA